VKPVIPIAALAAGVVLAATLGVTQAVANTGDRKGQIPATVIRRLTVLAYQWAAREGDRSPSSVLAVRTTLAKAMRMADRADTIPDSGDKPVYLVIEKGHFHPTGLLAMPGPPKPDLELIFGANHLIIDAVGAGYGSKLTPTVTFSTLQRLGPVTRLSPP
jgi:hypothetical protein